MTNPADKLSLLMATPNEEPVSQYKGVVQQTDDSKAYVLIDGGTAVWCDTMDVKALVGDRVRVEVRKHKGALIANYTHPVTDDAVANAADDKATEALGKVETLEVDALKADSAVIKNLQADTAKVHDLTADQLSAATAYVGELTAGEVTAQSIIADKAKLAQVDTDQLNADHAVIETLDSTYASIGSLNAATARIGDIEADYLKTADMTAEQARVGQLVAGKADVADLTAANARIDSLESTKADISFLESDYITADAIDATYLHADMSNADVAWIQNGVIKDGSISNAMINSLSANKLTAGTINGETINVTNINADNITAGTINGQRIGEGSLSLDKLSEDVYTEQEVDDKLSAMQAEIDGAIETWTGTTVPTLNNSPASDWKTAAVRDTHVGDVYFVVNSQSEQNGYNYRFTKSGSTYSWQLIKDSDVTNALQRLSTAEGKITTFDSDISTLKTDTGTLKTKTESLETRMSDAEDDILDKVDTTTFNEVSDTVDQHSQTITQMSQTLSNKADGSTVTALTTRVSKTEQDITGVNTTIGELQTTVESKADSSTVETVSNKLNTVSDTVDGHTSQLSSITTTQTSIQGSAVKSTVQLWFTKANTTAPSKPTAHVTTNDASTANAWNLAVPTYNSSYPYYYYCYEHQLLNDTYTWSAVTRDIATEESQSTSRSAASAAAAADTKAGNAASAAAAADTKAGNAAAAAATADGKAVSAQNTANKNVRESQQLWYTKANSTAPDKPTSKVTSTATTGGAWTTRVPTYSDDYKHYFYCMQYVAADNTVTWSDVIYDQATTEAQSVARAASADLTEFHQEYATFKQTTQQFESTVGETYATKNELKTTDDKIENLEIGGRNLLLGTNQGKTYWIEPSGNGTYAANTTIDGIGVRYEVLTQATNWCVFAYRGPDYNNLAAVALSAADEYFTVSFDIRPSVDLTTAMMATGSGFQFVNTNAANRQVIFGNPSFTLQKDVWNHVELTGKTLGVAVSTQCFYWNYKAPVGTYDFKNLKIERGTKATDWTPATEDIESSVSAIEQRVTNAETSITNNSREIGLRAKATDVYTKTESDGLISTEVTNRNAAIKESADAINLSVSQTYTTKNEFNNLEIGGRNLARNTADFSDWGRDNTVWTFSDGVATFTPPSTRSWKQLGQKPSAPLSLFDFDATYVISFDAMLVSGTVASGDSLSPCVALRDTADTDSRQRYRSWNIISSLTSEWQRITKVIDPLPISSWSGTASSEAYFGVDFWLYTATATIAIRNVKLEKGNKPTDWSPAPEDLEGRMSNAETRIDQNAEAITLRATKTEAAQMAQPNLVPWFSAGVPELPSTYWKCGEGTGATAIQHTYIGDGWCHIVLDNSSGSSTIRYDYDPVAAEGIELGKNYTFLFELRNIGSASSTNTQIYAVQAGTYGMQFWGNYAQKLLEGYGTNCTIALSTTLAQSGGNSAVLCDDGIYRKRVVRVSEASDSTYWTRSDDKRCVRLVTFCAAGDVFDAEFRFSIYQGDYDGPYKPYVGSQLYASQAELKVTNDSISSKVSTTDYNGQTIASLINQSADSVVIEAEHIELNGTTVFNTIKSNLDSNYDAKGAAQTVQNNLNNLEIGGRNLLLGEPTTFNQTGYKTYQIPTTIALNELSEGDKLTIQFWGVDADANSSGIGAFWGGGSLRLAPDSKPDTNGYWSAVYTVTAVHLANANSANKYIAVFNMVSGHSGMSLSIDRWKIERGNKATDWTPAPEDLASATDSVEYIAGTQTAATGSWTGVTRDSSLYTGKTIAYKLPYAGSGNASLQLKDSNGNNVGGNIAVYSMTTRVTTHYPAGSVIQMTYDGTYWRTAGWYNSNNYDRNLHNNYVKAAANVASGQMVCGTSAGYKPIAASVTFDMSYPILWAGGAWTSGTQYANAYETYPSVNPATTATVQGIAVNKMVYVKGTISGNTFTCAASNFLTCTVPTSEDGYFYLPVGIVANDATTKMYFNTSNDLYAYLDGKFRQVTPTEIVASHRVYYRTSTATSSLAAPTSWVTEATGNVYDAWTTKVPPLAASTESGQQKYLFLYTCEQRRRLDGTIQCTGVQLDENTTVIDGGAIIADSVTANQIAAGTITGNEIAGGTITSDNIAAGAISADRLDANALTLGNIEGLEDRLDAIDSDLSSISTETQWVHYDPDKGTVFGENGSANNLLVTGDGIDFNTSDGRAAWATNGVFHANEMEADTVEARTIVLGDWALVQSGTSFYIDYIG